MRPRLGAEVREVSGGEGKVSLQEGRKQAGWGGAGIMVPCGFTHTHTHSFLEPFPGWTQVTHLCSSGSQAANGAMGALAPLSLSPRPSMSWLCDRQRTPPFSGSVSLCTMRFGSVGVGGAPQL